MDEQNIQLVASLPKDGPASSRAYSHTTGAMSGAVVAASHRQEKYRKKAPARETTVRRSAKAEPWIVKPISRFRPSRRRSMARRSSRRTRAR